MGIEENWVRDTIGGCQIRLHVQPAAKKTEVVGLHGKDHLKVKIKAPAEDGRANEELIRFLATSLGMRKKDIEILRGDKSRNKDVLLHGQKMNFVQETLMTFGK